MVFLSPSSRDVCGFHWRCLLAKEISSRLETRVFIKAADDFRYRVYAGAYDERPAAADLRKRLAELGY